MVEGVVSLYNSLNLEHQAKLSGGEGGGRTLRGHFIRPQTWIQALGPDEAQHTRSWKQQERLIRTFW